MANMTIGEARSAYYSQYEKFRDAAAKVAKQKEQMEEQAKRDPNHTDSYEQEAATLELSYRKLKETANEFIDYQSRVIDQECAYANAMVADQQGDAYEESFQEMSKCMTVARRLMHGDKVPATDEKKLMEYDSDLYLACKQAQMMAQIEKRKEYKSLWEDEDEPKEYEDPMEYADHQQISVADGPDLNLEISDVVDNMEEKV